MATKKQAKAKDAPEELRVQAVHDDHVELYDGSTLTRDEWEALREKKRAQAAEEDDA